MKKINLSPLALVIFLLPLPCKGSALEARPLPIQNTEQIDSDEDTFNILSDITSSEEEEEEDLYAYIRLLNYYKDLCFLSPERSSRIVAERSILNHAALLAKQTLLHEAVSHNKLDTVKSLIQAGESVQGGILHYAIAYSALTTVMYLVHEGANVNEEVRYCNAAPLDSSCIEDGKEAIATYMAYEATPLDIVAEKHFVATTDGHSSTRMHQRAIAQFLIAHGAQTATCSPYSRHRDRVVEWHEHLLSSLQEKADKDTSL